MTPPLQAIRFLNISLEQYAFLCLFIVAAAGTLGSFISCLIFGTDREQQARVNPLLFLAPPTALTVASIALLTYASYETVDVSESITVSRGDGWEEKYTASYMVSSDSSALTDCELTTGDIIQVVGHTGFWPSLEASSKQQRFAVMATRTGTDGCPTMVPLTLNGNTFRQLFQNWRSNIRLAENNRALRSEEIQEFNRLASISQGRIAMVRSQFQELHSNKGAYPVR